MGAPQIEAFLAMLATERHVSAATHNQALSALLFLYREVLDIDVPWLAGINRPSSPKRIPSVLTQAEVAAVLSGLAAPEIAPLGRLLYGTGMRLMEGLRLRIKDVDFDRRVIVVREGKGGKDRVVMLPRSLEADLKRQVRAARCTWEVDRQARCAGVEVPHALASKYPDVGSRWGWFWLFPSPTMSPDPRGGTRRRCAAVR
jgi:site-specific recombinase XerD